jgi:hypothetical protein
MDVSSMDYLHVDYWTPDGTLLRVSPINTSIGKEAAYDFGTLTQESWVSVDIPISHFTTANSELTFNAIDQLKFDSEGTPGVFSLGTFYIDNIYFYSGTPTALPEVSEQALKVFPNPVSDILRLQDAAEGSALEIYSSTGALVKALPVQGGAVSVADLANGIYFVKVNGAIAKVVKK